jgi:hypothetical protein
MEAVTPGTVAMVHTAARTLTFTSAGAAAFMLVCAAAAFVSVSALAGVASADAIMAALGMEPAGGGTAVAGGLTALADAGSGHLSVTSGFAAEKSAARRRFAWG